MKKPAEFKRIPISQIDSSPFGIRREKPHTLVNSIRDQGLLSPIMVRPKENGRFEVIYGDRRLEDGKRAGLVEIDAQIRHMNSHEALVAHVTENLVRKDFNAIEEAHAYKALKKIGYKGKGIAKLVGKSEGLVASRLALLSLPEKVQEYVASGKLKVVLAQLIAHGVPTKFQQHVADTILEKNYEYYQALSYVESLRERFRLDKIAGSWDESHPGIHREGSVTLQDVKAPATVREEKKKVVGHRPRDLFDERHEQIRERLEQALGADALNLGSLQIWRLAELLQPKLRAYSRLYAERWKVAKALREDLELVEQKAKKTEIVPLSAS
jgi:ParB/RepB/Spo0J family partition protein